MSEIYDYLKSLGMERGSLHSKNKIDESGVDIEKEIENSSSGARFLHMTSNSIISRRCQDENGKEMYQNRAIVFAT